MDAVKVLEDSSASVEARVNAAKTLAGSRDAAALAALVKALEVTHEDVQAAARASLAKGDGAAFFAKQLKDSNEGPTRQRAGRVLRHLREPSTVPALGACLGDPVAEVRRECAHALAVFGAKDAVKPLIGALEDSSTDVRYFAILALGEVGSPEAKDALRKRLPVESDPTLKSELERVLQ